MQRQTDRVRNSKPCNRKDEEKKRKKETLGLLVVNKQLHEKETKQNNCNKKTIHVYSN